MQEKASSSDYLQAEEAVLIRHKKLKQIRRADNLVSEAQRRAKGLIKEAQAQAENLRKEAFLAGYEQGIACSIQAVGEFFSDYDTHLQKAFKFLRERAAVFLIEALNNEKTVSHILKEWLDEVNEDEPDETLYLMMPTAAKKYRTTIKHLTGDYQPLRLVLRYHERPAFIFKYRNRLAEFNPEELADTLLNRMIAESQLHQQCQRLSQDALNALHKAIDRFHLSEPDTTSE